jgi:hypothetical protein
MDTREQPIAVDARMPVEATIEQWMQSPRTLMSAAPIITWSILLGYSRVTFDNTISENSDAISAVNPCCTI